ncbi:CopG family ribbon-helix-helix protein [Caenimonas sp. SL110]|uniref:CopG family ribbon-helix-helix protein n=1 Tax=Caenimonas sp. SL110 TaxID=1450524 RepID=UPI00065438B6|nr:hypothetical protein [Caenimonas sp. SL110]
MPTLSVKIDTFTKHRIDLLAEKQGTTAHALMVRAIEEQLGGQEAHDEFVDDALRSYDEMVSSAKAYDGSEVISWLQAKSKGTKAGKPRLKSLKSLLKPR